MYRLDDNPLSRFPQDRPLSQDSGLWMVAHLKSRREKALAKELAARGVSYYLPLYVKRTRRKDNDKPRKSVCPLFPGYMAVAPLQEQLGQIAANRNVARLVKVVDQKRFTAELEQVRAVLSHDLEFRLHTSFARGTRVRVVNGLLKDMEGVVEKADNKTRLFISIEMFGQAISVEINEADLKPLAQPCA